MSTCFKGRRAAEFFGFQAETLLNSAECKCHNVTRDWRSFQEFLLRLIRVLSRVDLIMAVGSKSPAKKGKSTPAVKEKIFHPNSRKAGQLERASLRKSKLATASSKRSIKQIEKGSRHPYEQ